MKVFANYDIMSYIDIMSPSNYKEEKLSRNEARKLIAKVMASNPYKVRFTGHSLEEMAKDDLKTTDVLNILKSVDSRIHEEGELYSGSYRYRLHTRFICVVVGFNIIGTELVVVTAWDKRKERK